MTDPSFKIDRLISDIEEHHKYLPAENYSSTSQISNGNRNGTRNRTFDGIHGFWDHVDSFVGYRNPNLINENLRLKL
jgi:hypothetical protein